MLLLPVFLGFYPRFLLRAGLRRRVDTGNILSKLRFFSAQLRFLSGEDGLVALVHPVLVAVALVAVARRDPRRAPRASPATVKVAPLGTPTLY